MNSLFVLACLATLTFAKASFDYCELNCPHLRWDHIQCGKNGSLSPRCPVSIETGDLSEYEDLSRLLLDLHNNFRNKVAGGGLTGFPKATTMATMSWSKEHAKNAYYNVKDCTYETDPCHDIEKGKRSGQNVAVFYIREDELELSIEHWVEKAFTEWADKCTLAENPKEVVESFPESGLNVYGDCIRMVMENNNKLGCGAGLASGGGEEKIFWLVCNYEEDIDVGHKIYNSGCESANSNYTNLCSLDQKY